MSGCAGYGDQRSDWITYGNAISTQAALSVPGTYEANPIYEPFADSVGGVALYTVGKLGVNWMFRNYAPKPLCKIYIHINTAVGSGLIVNDLAIFAGATANLPLYLGIGAFVLANKFLFGNNFSKKECNQ